MTAARIVAVCGIDGVGKTALLRAAAPHLPPLVDVVTKRGHRNTDLVTEHIGRAIAPTDLRYERFSRINATAAALDFLDHYTENIAPLLRPGTTVVCDRYSPCYEAYAASVNDGGAVQLLLARLPRPDLVIFVDAPMEVVYTRLAAKGEAISSPEGFSDGYEQVLPRQPKLATISNIGPIAERAAELAALIRDVAEAT